MLGKKKTPEKKGVEFKDPLEPAQKRTRVVIKPFKSAGLEIEREKKKKAAEEPVKEKEKEKEKEKVEENPEGDKSKETRAAATTTHEKALGPEVVHITGLDQPLHEKRNEPTTGKGPEVAKPTKPAQADASIPIDKVTSTTRGSASVVHKEKSAAAGGAGADVNVCSSVFAAAQVGAGSQSLLPHPPIGPKYTLGDIYYKTYTEEACGDAPHHPPWGLKQKDTCLEFNPCRDWFLNSFPPGEGLRDKLRAAKDLLSNERADWKKRCEKDNQRMYAARAKITDLEAQTATLTQKVEDLGADKECFEAELKAQVANRDKDLHAKDVEIAELNRRLREQTEKSEYLDIDLDAERVIATTAEEAK
ncbi:hypothetical protein Hanom_Chr12g01157981 [Helianthus anomalus]